MGCVGMVCRVWGLGFRCVGLGLGYVGVGCMGLVCRVWGLSVWAQGLLKYSTATE